MMKEIVEGTRMTQEIAETIGYNTRQFYCNKDGDNVVAINMTHNNYDANGNMLLTYIAYGAEAVKNDDGVLVFPYTTEVYVKSNAKKYNGDFCHDWTYSDRYTTIPVVDKNDIVAKYNSEVILYQLQHSEEEAEDSKNEYENEYEYEYARENELCDTWHYPKWDCEWDTLYDWCETYWYEYLRREMLDTMEENDIDINKYDDDTPLYVIKNDFFENVSDNDDGWDIIHSITNYVNQNRPY